MSLFDKMPSFKRRRETPGVEAATTSPPNPSAGDFDSVLPGDQVEGYDDELPVTPLPMAEQPAPGDSKRRVPERRRVRLVQGFRDPASRPRYILFAGAAVLVLAAVMIVALGVTSTRWFCSEACHKVQDDTIIAYEHSSHSEISCMSCHMPAGAGPVVFILHKAEALGELYLTVRDDFELPLNAESEVALTMASTQCTQCHDIDKRTVTASDGIIIDHAVHADNEVSCTICHNRIAHKEDFELTLKDPKTGEPNQPHQEFDSMTACFRCHTQGKPVSSLKAPGTCKSCHPKGFELKPESHLQEDFFPEGHAELAKEEASRVAEYAEESGEGGAAIEEGATDSSETVEETVVVTEPAAEPDGEESLGESLPSVESINECYTCHAQKFCDDCHGVPMPHPASFQKWHGKYGEENPDACVKCHGPANEFCDDCHHGTSLGVELSNKPWIEVHPATVRTTGSSACFDCHDPTYCAKCHVRGGSTD